MTISRRSFLKGFAALLAAVPLVKLPAPAVEAAPVVVPTAPAPVIEDYEGWEDEDLGDLDEVTEPYEPLPAFDDPYVPPPLSPEEIPTPLDMGRVASTHYRPHVVEVTWVDPQEPGVSRFLKAVHERQLVNIASAYHSGDRRFNIIGHVLSYSVESFDYDTVALTAEIDCRAVLEVYA